MAKKTDKITSSF